MKNKSIFAAAFVCVVIIAAQPAIASDAPKVTLPSAPALPASTEQPASEDKVVDFMNQSIKAYQDGKFKESLKLSDEAQNGIRDRHAELYRALLPSVPSGGWTLEDKADVSATLGTPIVGGMSVVARSYKGGGHTATIAYIVDSPMMSLLSNVMQAISSASGPNVSTEDIKGNKATYREQSTERKGANHQLMIFAGDVMVLVQSDTLPKETLLQFANLVDFDKLKTVQ